MSWFQTSACIFLKPPDIGVHMPIRKSKRIHEYTFTVPRGLESKSHGKKKEIAVVEKEKKHAHKMYSRKISPFRFRNNCRFGEVGVATTLTNINKQG